MGDLEETFGDYFHNKRRRGPENPPPIRTPGNQITRALLQLALRHESQLQALAMEDQFIHFFTRRSKKHPPNTAEGHEGEEGAAAEGYDHHGTTQPLESAGTPQQIRKGDEGQTSGRHLATAPAGSAHQPEGRMVLDAVQHAIQKHNSPQPGTDPYGEDAVVATGIGGTMPESEPGPSIQVLEV